MDNKLKKLFDFQRFQGNDRMETLISETENRYGETPKGLSDEELDSREQRAKWLLADIWRLPRGSHTPLLCSVASLMPRCLQRGY